jgi:hypothetical protein
MPVQDSAISRDNRLPCLALLLRADSKHYFVKIGNRELMYATVGVRYALRRRFNLSATKERYSEGITSTSRTKTSPPSDKPTILCKSKSFTDEMITRSNFWLRRKIAAAIAVAVVEGCVSVVSF